jgi:hypothetical protein
LHPYPGAVFADLQLFPGAGAWHSSERAPFPPSSASFLLTERLTVPEIFGTFNPPTATAPEVTLSQTMQTIVANFVKNPAVSPAPNWSKYVPGSATTTLAKLAYNGNVVANNVVQAVESDSIVSIPSHLFQLRFIRFTGWTMQRFVEPILGYQGVSAVLD